MKIVKLEAANVKRLKAVSITPSGALVVIGGKNGAGKTSVLDSIAYALGGKSLVPSKPIRKGEETATVTVDLGEMVVERTFTTKGSYLSVKNKDGFKASSPQVLLDALVGKLSFDPLAFANMEPGKQAATLRDLVGVDFSKWDGQRQAAYDRRTEAGREVKRLEAVLASSPVVKDAPATEVSVAGLMAELKTAQAHNRDGEELNRLVQGALDTVEEMRQDVHVSEGQIADLERKLTSARAQLSAERNAQKEAEKDVVVRQHVVGLFRPADDASIQQRIADADGINAKVRQQVQASKTANLLITAKQAVLKDATEIDGIDGLKAKALAEAKFPVAGLSFDATGVLLNDLPFDQASAAEKLRVSVAMGLAMNPKLRVILIRDGSLLDEDNLKLIAEMAETQDAQVWIERVGEGTECSVVIEDGAVKEGADR